MAVLGKEPGLVDTCNRVANREFYNPVDYQITAPIYYFQDAHDPATPLDQAFNHYSVQNQTRNKTWINVSNGGHSPLLAHDQLAPCAPEIWNRIDQLKGFDGVIDENGGCEGSATSLSLSGSAPSVPKLKLFKMLR